MKYIYNKIPLFTFLSLFILPCNANDVDDASLWAIIPSAEQSVMNDLKPGGEYLLPFVWNQIVSSPYVVLTRCKVGTGSGRFWSVRHTVIAYPNKVQIAPGYEATISVTGTNGSFYEGGWNLGFGIGTTTPDTSKTENLTCFKLGDSWANYYPTSVYPMLDSAGIEAMVTLPVGIPSGEYRVPVNIRLGMYYRRHMKGFSPTQTISASEMLGPLSPATTLTTLIINVRSSCDIKSGDIVLAHGRLVLGAAERHKVSRDVTFSCTGDANIDMELKSLSPPEQTIPNEYRVGLGNGWDSRLTLNDKSSPLNFQITSAGTQTFTISSELVKGNAAREGALSGSAVLLIKHN